MNRDILHSIEVPLLSRKGIIRLLDMLSRKDLNSSSTMYDAGYEQAKKDIAVILEQELNISFESNPACRLAKQLRNST